MSCVGSRPLWQTLVGRGRRGRAGLGQREGRLERKAAQLEGQGAWVARGPRG